MAKTKSKSGPLLLGADYQERHVPMATEQRIPARTARGHDPVFRRATVFTAALAIALWAGLVIWDSFAPVAGHAFLAATGFIGVPYAAVSYHAWFNSSWTPLIAGAVFLGLGLLAIRALHTRAELGAGRVSIAGFYWGAVAAFVAIGVGYCGWQYHEAQDSGARLHAVAHPTQSTVDETAGQARMQLSLWKDVTFRVGGRPVSLGNDLVLAYGSNGRYLYDMATGKTYAPDTNSVSYTGGPQY
ncbi:MAG TPA: hypothetical protein VL551_27490 [Actinospica sp.]|nr:hypothetical protein [Actinospica sp.]